METLDSCDLKLRTVSRLLHYLFVLEEFAVKTIFFCITRLHSSDGYVKMIYKYKQVHAVLVTYSLGNPFRCQLE